MSRSWCRGARPAARRRGAGRGSPAGRSCPGRSAARTRPGLSTGTVADIYIFSSGNTLQRRHTIFETFNWNPGAWSPTFFESDWDWTLGTEFSTKKHVENYIPLLLESFLLDLWRMRWPHTPAIYLRLSSRGCCLNLPILYFLERPVCELSTGITSGTGSCGDTAASTEISGLFAIF